ncbi:uncharacterized protein LOC6638831 [Drosophila willistoni]|uniref:uncharacterized protein LOC6638831 n=1 Tax=Drosophila willistoni TaxID=7260 RepID=UPI001F07CF93|nr:uncharacterized protein LOC6638831 [Drosophila willistoni]
MLLTLVLVILPLSCFCIKIEGNKAGKDSPTLPPSPPNYRISKPELKKPLQRVPPHLQDIRPGYVDDDAGDVIRIIEPPQHFQQLKKLRQRQPQLRPEAAALVWEQPRKLSSNRFPPSQPTKTVDGDLLTQETQNSLQLPMEILASVRKTERLLQRQHQKLPPLVRQRHIQRQTHTLIAQKSLQNQIYQRGQHQRLKAVLSQSQALDHKRSKRVKREEYDVQKGLKLVAHIGELLKNATVYLPEEAKRTSGNYLQSCGNATNCDSRRRRQRLFKQSKSAEWQWQGEKQQKGRNFRNGATTSETTSTIKPTIIIPTTALPKATTSSSFTISTTSAIPLASRLVNSRKSPNNNRNSNNTSASAVLYADVMTNIRSLWQEHDYFQQQSKAIQPDQITNNTNYQSLDMYLKELDKQTKELPTPNSH